jgi:hypothetical protein
MAGLRRQKILILASLKDRLQYYAKFFWLRRATRTTLSLKPGDSLCSLTCAPWDWIFFTGNQQRENIKLIADR